MPIKSERVEELFMDCLFKDGEEIVSPITTEGIVTNTGFHPARLKSHEEEIVSMLKELPDNFHESRGGGWSFLNACMDRNGKQWTGLHQRMEQLFLLGIGIGKVVFLMPREMWSVFPGGMPYVVVKE